MGDVEAMGLGEALEGGAALGPDLDDGLGIAEVGPLGLTVGLHAHSATTMSHDTLTRMGRLDFLGITATITPAAVQRNPWM
jgi:hypothetical protein